jgi:hypothetical protein
MLRALPFPQLWDAQRGSVTSVWLVAVRSWPSVRGIARSPLSVGGRAHAAEESFY